jgi:hypothetical protein
MEHPGLGTVAVGSGAPPRDPTVVRTGRRRGQRRLIAGGLVLVIGTVAAVVALVQSLGGGDPRRVHDAAGITYTVPAAWTMPSKTGPALTLERNGQVAATFSFSPTDTNDAGGLLSQVDPSVCDGQPQVFATIEGSEQGARCDNGGGDKPAVAIGAISHGVFWVITVDRSVPAAERDAFLSSIELGAPEPL